MEISRSAKAPLLILEDMPMQLIASRPLVVQNAMVQSCLTVLIAG